ncbi:MAG: polysaccharide biosynthesis protein [Candidatus Moraniibacteriota bacterium]
MDLRNILIVGAGKAGRLLAQDINTNYPDCRVVGFVDDKLKISKSVLGNIDVLPKLLKLWLVDEIVIAIPSADGALVRRILLVNIKNRIPIRIVPRDQRIIGKSEVRYGEVRPLDPEDFLGRPFHRQHVDRLTKYYRGKTIFVTGGAGSIGSEIVRQLIDLQAKQVIVYDNSEYLVFLLEQQLKERGQRDKCKLIVGSILHDNKLLALLARYKPDIVFHAAAYKHVHLMQDNIDEAVYNNAIGTRRVIDAAMAAGIGQFTFISTDKVVNPTSVMGATKKLCEYYIQSLRGAKTKFNIVRFGNVINSNGSALPLFERQMELHGYVTVTHKKMQRFFMSIREAASLVIESTAAGRLNSIHILNMGELINIHDVALCLIRSKNLASGEDVEVRITGLRKGEKMIEELYSETEKGNLRQLKGGGSIYTLKNRDTCPVDIVCTLDMLESIVKEGDAHGEIKKKMRLLFPSLKKI